MTIRIEKGRRAGTAGRKGAAFNAFDGDRKVGRIELDRKDDYAKVAWVTVEEGHQRRGIATKLYETAAAFACSEWKRPLGSDHRGMRAIGSEGFWLKQYERGRATRIGPADSSANRFLLTCPAPSSLAGTRTYRR